MHGNEQGEAVHRVLWRGSAHKGRGAGGATRQTPAAAAAITAVCVWCAPLATNMEGSLQSPLLQGAQHRLPRPILAGTPARDCLVGALHKQPTETNVGPDRAPSPLPQGAAAPAVAAC